MIYRERMILLKYLKI